MAHVLSSTLDVF